MSTFKNSLALCGLSQSEAARFFDVSIQSVKDWSRGRSRPPEGVWVMLASRMRSILDAADFAADHMDLKGIDPRAWCNIEVTIGEDIDREAEKMAGALGLLMAINDLIQQST